MYSAFVLVGSVSPPCRQIHRGRRPGVAPGPLRYRHSFRFTPLLAGLLVGTCGGIPGRTTSKVFKSRAWLRPYIYIYAVALLTTVHMFGIHLTGVFASMVFCKECQQKVEECPHFVPPIKAKRVEVFDEKVKSLAYDAEQRILEIAFKSGQVWQLFSVPRRVCRYAESLRPKVAMIKLR